MLRACLVGQNCRLTLDPEVDSLPAAPSGALVVCCRACVCAGAGAGDALQDQAVVAHDHAGGGVVGQRDALKRKKKKKKTE